MVLIMSRSFSSPSASIFAGVSAILKTAGVARLTPASVACADSTTATKSVNGLTEMSSPFGSGLAASKRLKIASTSAGLSLVDLAMETLFNRPHLGKRDHGTKQPEKLAGDADASPFFDTRGLHRGDVRHHHGKLRCGPCLLPQGRLAGHG